MDLENDSGNPDPGGAADLTGDPADTAAKQGDGQQQADAGGDGANQAADPEWYSQVSADKDGDEPSLRDWVKSTGVKDLGGLAKMARDNMKAVRDSGRIKVPGEGASAEDVAAFRKAIGVPDDAKGYEFGPPKDANGEVLKDAAGEPVKLDQALLDRLAAKAHEAGVPKAGMEALVADFVQAQLEELGARDKALNDAAAKWKKDQGGQATDKLAAVESAAQTLGLTRTELLNVRAALGAERSLDLLAKIGAGLGEDTLIRGDRAAARFGLSGDAAQKQLDQRKQDAAWVEKAMVPGTAENAEYTRLVGAISTEADRKAAEAMQA